MTDDHRICALESRLSVLETQRDGAEKALMLVADALKTQVRALFALLMLSVAIVGLLMRAK